MGNTLGRVEAKIAVGGLVARFPKLYQVAQPVYFGRARFRGFDAYRVAVR